MARLKVPSLQHLARLFKPDAQSVTKSLLSLLDGAPNFSYEPLYVLIREMAAWDTPYEQLVAAIKRKGYRKDVQQRYLDILPLVHKFFCEKKIDFSVSVAPRYYSVDRDLQVPFAPPMLYSSEGKLYLPWFIFWKDNPLKGERLSLFVSIVSDILRDDPDLESAELLIVDLSQEDEDEGRTLKVVPANEVPRLTQERQREMLEIFACGFRQARALAASRPSKKRQKTVSAEDANQLKIRFAT